MRKMTKSNSDFFHLSFLSISLSADRTQCFGCHLHGLMQHFLKRGTELRLSGDAFWSQVHISYSPAPRGGFTHRGMYPGWPDEGRDKQGGQAEQKAQRALHVSGHDEEDSGSQPVVARIDVLFRGWKERLKKPQAGWK